MNYLNKQQQKEECDTETTTGHNPQQKKYHEFKTLHKAELEVRTSLTAELIKHISTNHRQTNKICCAEHDDVCVSLTGSITDKTPPPGASFLPTHHGLRKQAPQCFIRRLMTVYTSTYV